MFRPLCPKGDETISRATMAHCMLKKVRHKLTTQQFERIVDRAVILNRKSVRYLRKIKDALFNNKSVENLIG